MIDLYYWTTPNGHKITLFLEETGLPYRIHPVDLNRVDQFKPEFPAISPNNRIRAIVDNSPSDVGHRYPCLNRARSWFESIKARPAARRAYARAAEINERPIAPGRGIAQNPVFPDRGKCTVKRGASPADAQMVGLLYF